MTEYTKSDKEDAVLERVAGRLPYTARAAMCFMHVDDEGDDVALYNQLCDALRADSRVESINAPKQDAHAFDRPSFSIFGSREEEFPGRHDHAPAPGIHTHAFYFRDPILLEVHAPRRVQPTFEDFDSIPADRYWAAWDGIALVVLWELEDFKKSQASLEDRKSVVQGK